MRFFDTHTHSLALATSDVTSIYNLRISELCDAPADGYFSAGIHPYDVENSTPEWIENLRTIAQHLRCLAIGEAGIDHQVGNIELQNEIFAVHCALAEELHKPLIIHCVRAQGEILQISESVSEPRIFHSYSKVNQEISRAQNIAYSLSARNIEQSTKIPLDQILLETDDGHTSIEEVYTLLADARQMSVDEVMRVVEQNFFRIFAL